MPVKQPPKSEYSSPGEFLGNVELIAQLEIAPLTFGESALWGNLMGVMVLGGEHYDFGSIEGTMTVRGDARGRIFIHLRRVYTGEYTSFSLPKNKREDLLAWVRKGLREWRKANGTPLHAPEL